MNPNRRQFMQLGLAGGLSLTVLKDVKAASKEVKENLPPAPYFESTYKFTHKQLLELAKKHGSPLYVYDGDLIKKRFNEFHTAFKNEYSRVKVHYALKANTNLNIVSLLRKEGAGAECISIGEMMIAKKVGHKNQDIILTSSSKSDDELTYAVKNNILVNLDSLEDLDNLIRICTKLKRKASISFRINPDVNPQTHKNINTGHKFTKFGILQTEGQITKAYKTARDNKWINVRGVHSHIGSQILEVQPFLENVTIHTEVLRKLKLDLNMELEFMNLGGGLGIPYLDNQEGLTPEKMAKTICPVLKENLKFMKKLPELWFEPGRYFVAQSGILISRVNSVKHSPYTNFINVDTGFNHLARPMLYQAHHRVRVLGKNSDKKVFQIAGNICETGDILTDDRILPTPNPGDHIALLDAGAYGFSMASEYNSFYLPPEVMILGGKEYLDRKSVV